MGLTLVLTITHMTCFFIGIAITHIIEKGFRK